MLAQATPACGVAREVARTIVGIPRGAEILKGGDVRLCWARDRVTVEMIIFRQPRADGSACGTVHFTSSEGERAS